ncbi:hypothetical protein ACH5RR_026147 [Cinchona calisaya]|uniref:Protein IQ-DOMAIN 1 n=1 Tax=Cinchona calisaya TaxID=153742 RepID=A0ABD2Z520_9GENT
MGSASIDLVRGVFFKTRSCKACAESADHGRSNAVEKKGWSSVKSYLCADECNSVLGENDSASVRQLEVRSVVAERNSAHTTRLLQIHSDFAEDTTYINSSEATVTQTVVQEIPDESNTKSISNNGELWREKKNSTYKLFQQEDAAMTIQSAFRSYLASRQMELKDGKQEIIGETAIPSQSLGSSIKAQTGNSTCTSLVDVESINLCQPMQKRVRVQVPTLQEDWDDSTVSSTISNMRIQNRKEAATRRERALAYAFAQQLRVCSKTKCTKSNNLDVNKSWNWLERWMATRQQEYSFFSNKDSKRTELHSCNRQSFFRNKSMDATTEEESCGSNDVSIQIDGVSVAPHTTQNHIRPAKSKGKAVRSITKQQIGSSRKRLKEAKASRTNFQAEAEKGSEDKFKQPGSKKETKSQDI